jgi:hypothetical protein
VGQESVLPGVSRRLSAIETNTVHMAATVSLQCPSGPLAYHASGPAPMMNRSWSEGSDVSPTSGATSHGLYSADTQSGANTVNGLGRNLHSSRQLVASRKRAMCESFLSDPTGGAAPQPCNAPQQPVDNDDDGNDTDDNTMQVCQGLSPS